MGWHEVAGADTLGEDEAMAVVLGERPIALCRSGGRFYALHNVCTHQYALLSDGYVEDGCIECPLHQGRFDLQTGTPKEIVERLAPMLIQAGSDPKVQQMLNNFILSSPADLETTARIFKRDSDVMLRILRDLGVKPSE